MCHITSSLPLTDYRLLMMQGRSLWQILIFGAAATVANLSVEAAAPAFVSGDGHYLALTDSGVLYSWGRNDFGQLGFGGKPASSWGHAASPAIVAPPPGFTWAAIAAGDNHSLAISSDGSLWGWGRNDVTQLGFRTSLTRRWLAGGHRESSPVRISSDKNWLSVSGGMLSSFALKRDGSLWACGGNWMGQLADGQSRKLTDFNSPVEKLPQIGRLSRVGHDSDWVRISAGSEHVLAQKRDGTLWAWGRNDCGQLGVGNYVSTNRPVRISSDANWTTFAAAGVGQRGGWTAAIKKDGTLWVWGNWKRLKLPNGGAPPNDTNMASRPLRLGRDTNWMRIACGNETSAAVKTDGTLWTWERNMGAAETSIVPRPHGIDHDWSDVSAIARGFGTEGAIHARKADGTLWTWDPQILPAKGIPPATGVASNAPHQILRLRNSSKTP